MAAAVRNRVSAAAEADFLQDVMVMVDALIEYVAHGFEITGILVIVAGTLCAFLRYAGSRDYHLLREYLARSILLGLELLIAADIVATITVMPTLDNLWGLALIVLIRTFLSFTLELEATGRFPWQREDTANTPQH